MASEAIAYNRSELRGIIKAFQAMDEQAVAEAKKESNALAEFLAQKIREKASTRTFAETAVRRVADGGKVSKTSKIGEIKFGFARQRFSGGGTTQKLWPGLEFGSNKFKQFPTYSGRFGRGSRGWFIYPTLRRIQPELVAKWQKRFAEILDEWAK